MKISSISVYINNLLQERLGIVYMKNQSFFVFIWGEKIEPPQHVRKVCNGQKGVS